MVAPNPVAFSILGIDVMWYGVMLTLGILSGGIVAYVRAPQYNIPQERLLDAFLICVPLSIVGARLYYVIFNWEYYGFDLMKIINIRSGGLAIHGALLFALVAALLLCMRWGIKKGDAFDLVAPSLVLGQAIGRWGNFFNEEAHGGLTDFPINVFIDGQHYHATFLYESIWCFLLFFFLLWFSKRRSFGGQIFLLYGILYSVERFFVEGLRTDSLMIGMFRQAQVISVVIIVVALIIYFVIWKKKEREEHSI